MRASYKIALYLAGVGACAVLAKAEPMDAYLMPAFSYTQHLSSLESGGRMGGRMEFGRFGKNIALDVRFGTGTGYTDYGVAFKAFGHWDFGASQNMSVDLGGSAIVLYSKGYEEASIKQAFNDLGISPFVRFTYDTGLGFGIMADAGVELMMLRRTRTTTLATGSSSGKMRMRMYFALGVPIEF